VTQSGGEMKDYKLVHAAPPEFFSSEDSWKYTDETSFAVWKRDLNYQLLPGSYTMIMGHTPTIYYEEYNGHLSIYHFKSDPVIDIDCGSAFDDVISVQFPFQGRLGCLRLEDMKEFYSEEGSKAEYHAG
jgi:serine/threonine protein phosphatase 1